MPLISVLMPVYNAETFLREAVESILGQTFRDFEFLIVNDGSIDKSLKILEHYARLDERIRLISRPNTGYVVALNEMLALARGDLIARMDADDISLPRRFELQVMHLQNHLNCVAVGGKILMIDPDGWTIGELQIPETHEEIDSRHMLGLGGAIAHPAVMMRRGVLFSVGGYRVDFEPAEDRDLWLRLAEHGRLANLPEILLHYRLHAGSAGHMRREQQCRNGARAVAEAHVRRNLPWQEPDAPAGQPPTLAAHHLKWAWWALRGGNVRTARKHAKTAIRLSPFSWESWKMMACVLRGY